MKHNIIIIILIFITFITFFINKKFIENFNDFIYNSDFYKSIKLDKIDIQSPYSGDSLFKLYLNKEYNVVYKKAQKHLKIDIQQYKKKIYSLKYLFIINKYIYKPQYIFIEDDGSYYSIYIKNGVTLYNIINKNNIIDKKTKNNIIDKLEILKEDLIIYNNKYKLFGDWNPSNIMYNYEDESLYNIDYEGFGRMNYFHISPYKENNINYYINKLIFEIENT